LANAALPRGRSIIARRFRSAQYWKLQMTDLQEALGVYFPAYTRGNIDEILD
jgi:hypothetical protein